MTNKALQGIVTTSFFSFRTWFLCVTLAGLEFHFLPFPFLRFTAFFNVFMQSMPVHIHVPVEAIGVGSTRSGGGGD